MRDEISISLWAYNLGYKISSIQEWLEIVDQGAMQAIANKSDLLVLPEYISEHWLTFMSDNIPLSGEIEWMAGQALVAFPQVQKIADKYNLSILAGSVPASDGIGGFNNRAYLYRPGGTEPIIQNKLCLTPNEKNPDGWCLTPGNDIQIIDFDGVKIAIVICLDIELPALSAYLAKHAAELDMILVPSMTERLSGYSRVFGCAKARAVELQIVVCAVGVIGATPLTPPRPNVSGASVYIPCEELLGNTGILHAIDPRGDDTGYGPILHATDIPIAKIRNIRENLAEVWPGAWTSESLTHTKA